MQLKLLARATLGFFLLACAFGHPSRGQEPKLIVAPIPKPEALEELHPFAAFSEDAALTPHAYLISARVPKPAARKVGRSSRFALDRSVVTLGLIQGASELFDGATTRHFLLRCSTCTEIDPVSHFLLGARPTWAGMIAAGSVEALAATYFNQGMRHSPHKFVRRCAPLVPLLLTGIHFIEGVRNLPLKNVFYCTTPGYIVVGSHCMLQPPAPAGIARVLSPGITANPTGISLLHFK